MAKCGALKTSLTLGLSGQLLGFPAKSSLGHTLLPQSCLRAAPSFEDFSRGMAAESLGGAKQ